MLKLYALGYTPNAEGQLHFIGTHAQLLTRLGTPALQVDGNDYRINGGQLFVTFSNNANYVDAITYAIDTDDTGKWRCYHVNSGRIESGFVVFDVSVDWWGTAYNDANVTRLELRALNRKLSRGGEYQQPARVYGLPSYEKFSEETERIDLVFVAVVDDAKEAVSGSVKKTQIYSVQYTPDNLRLVSSLYGAVGTSTDTVVKFKAQVLSAWIIPHAWLPSYTVAQFFRTFDGINDINFEARGYKAAVTNVDISTFTGNPQKLYRFGTKTQSLLLRNTVNSDSRLWVQCTVGQSDVSVFIYQDCEGLDISNSLAVTLTTTDGNITTAERTAKVLGSVASALSAGAQIGGGAALTLGGNPLGVVAMSNGAANMASAAANVFAPQYKSGQTPTGDGLATLEGTAMQGFYSPLRLISYSAAPLCGAYKARMLGAAYVDRVTYSGLASFVSTLYPLIGEAPSNSTWPDATYIEARAEYKGQEAAASVIKSHIARGVLYEVL